MQLPSAREHAELIEVVRITDPIRHLRAADLTGDDVAIWDGTRVGSTLALIADLPAGERTRCFTPGWGVRAHGATDLLFQIAFCFHCNGARLWGPAVPAAQARIHTFAPDSAPARELLQRFREA